MTANYMTYKKIAIYVFLNKKQSRGDVCHCICGRRGGLFLVFYHSISSFQLARKSAQPGVTVYFL